MTTHLHDKENVTFVEAIEFLNLVTNLQPGAYDNTALIAEDEQITNTELVQSMKVALATILVYLKQVRSGSLEHLEGFEGVHTVMDLVDSAVKRSELVIKRDAPNTLSIKKFHEYLDLKMFFRKNLSRDIDEGVLQRWAQKIAKGIDNKRWGEPSASFPSKYAFIDLESIRKDIDYDLLYIRKEDGSRFFSSQLLKSMKLVCDVKTQEEQLHDFYQAIPDWRKSSTQRKAAKLHALLGTPIQQFFSQADRNQYLVKKLSQAFMALMLASLPQKNPESSDSVSKYFCDFFTFFFEVLAAPEYHAIKKKNPQKLAQEEKLLLEVIIRICRAIIGQVSFWVRMADRLGEILQKEVEGASFSEKIVKLHKHIHNVEKQHVSKIIGQTLQDFEDGECNIFTPLSERNIPEILYTLYQVDKSTKVLRMPLPITQTAIQKAHCSEVFSAYLLGGKLGIFETRHLTISSLDPTLWKDYARSLLLNDMENNAYGKGHYFVLTLPKRSDFYEQKGPYENIKGVGNFLSLFAEQLFDKGTGFIISSGLKRLDKEWVLALFEAMRRIFFKENNVLSRDERKIFIDLAYLLLSLKAYEDLSPLSMNFQTTDGLDAALIDSMLLGVLLKTIKGEEFSKEYQHNFLAQLFLPSLLIRSRGVHEEPMKRGVAVLTYLEQLQKEFGVQGLGLILQEALEGPFFANTLKLELLFPSLEEE